MNEMSTVESFIRENIDHRSDDPFYVFNIEDVIEKHEKWLDLLPRVKPYYAVKANRFPLLLELMVELGLNFDCASQYEIDAILNRGGNPRNIIFANPCKTNKCVEFSKQNSIDLMTFDNEEELARIHSFSPESRLLLRIKVDDKNSNVRLSLKFGADMKYVEKLLKKAKLMELNVIGIAFHVGSGCQSNQSYIDAIENSRKAFDIGLNLGFPMSVLDIGGGFPGTERSYHQKLSDNSSSFEEMAAAINHTLGVYYPENTGLTIIGEPGRYYCESAFSLVTKIISKNIIDSTNGKTVMYYLNDGIYGSFMDAIIDKKIYKPVPLMKNNSQLFLRKVYNSILWGPTCDSYDCIRSDFPLSELNIGEWLMFEDMGAYSMPYAEFGFNGIPSPKCKIFVSETAQNYLMKSNIWSKIKSFVAEYKWKQIYSEDVWYQMG